MEAFRLASAKSSPLHRTASLAKRLPIASLRRKPEISIRSIVNSQYTGYNTSRRSYRSYYWRQNTSFLDRITPSQLTWTLIGMNAAIFAAFNLSIEKPSWWPVNYRTMCKHFTFTLGSFEQGLWHTAVTHAFAHVDTRHFLFNMIGLYSFGMGAASILGVRKFMQLYLSGALVSAASFVIYEKYYRKRERPRFLNRPLNWAAPGVLGASGAVNALSVFFCVMMPTATFQLYGVLPIPAVVATALFVGYDLFNALTMTNSTTAHSGHLGGAFAGLVYGLMLRRRLAHRY